MAARKKGLSADEKRVRLLDLFYESKEFFQMKELEKIAPKKKGIISQSVKEVTQILVNESLVECEKIGTFVCYWAFPTKAAQIRAKKLKDLNEKIKEGESKVKECLEGIKENQIGREDCEERRELLEAVEKMRKEEEETLRRLKELQQFDPCMIEEIKEEMQRKKEDANRWTDNIMMIKKYCKVNFGMDEKNLDKQFEIPENFDYI